MATVYLAGPIQGMDSGYVLDWREKAMEYLSNRGIDTLSPSRYRIYKQKGFVAKPSHGHALDKEITSRDRLDVSRSNLILANFLGATSASCGTPIEFGWGDILRVPIVQVIEDEGNPYDHGMMNSIAGFRRNDLYEALELVEILLGKVQ